MTLNFCNICFSVVLSYAVMCKTSEAQNESCASPPPTRSDNWVRYLPFEMRRIVEEARMKEFILHKSLIQYQFRPPPSPRCRYIGGYTIQRSSSGLKTYRSRFIPLEVVRSDPEVLLDSDAFLMTRVPYHFSGEKQPVGFNTQQPLNNTSELLRYYFQKLKIPVDNRTYDNIFEKVEKLSERRSRLRMDWGKQTTREPFESVVTFLYGLRRRIAKKSVQKWNIIKLKPFNKSVPDDDDVYKKRFFNFAMEKRKIHVSLITTKFTRNLKRKFNITHVKRSVDTASIIRKYNFTDQRIFNSSNLKRKY